MPSLKLTQDILLAAIEGFESQKRRIDVQIAELRQMAQGGPAEAADAPVAKKGRRKLSAAARARMAEGQRKRWEQVKGTSEPAPAATPGAAPGGPKRKLSAAGRRAIIEATKKRWARVRAEAAKAAKAQARPDKTAVKKGPVKGSRKAAKRASPRKTATTAQAAAPATTE